MPPNMRTWFEFLGFLNIEKPIIWGKFILNTFFVQYMERILREKTVKFSY